MDMRFPGLDPDPIRSGAAQAIDFPCFVAALAAGQTVTPTARAAARAQAALAQGPKRVTPALLHALDSVSPSRPAGAFHRAAAATVQASASNLKSVFTVAFQPSFKPADL